MIRVVDIFLDWVIVLADRFIFLLFPLFHSRTGWDNPRVRNITSLTYLLRGTWIVNQNIDKWRADRAELFPLLLQVQTINRCNGKCGMCPYPYTVHLQRLTAAYACDGERIGCDQLATGEIVAPVDSDLFRVNEETWELEPLRPGFIPEVQLSDEYSDVSRVLQSFAGTRILGLESLKVSGLANLSGASLKGRVRIENRIAAAADFGDPSFRSRAGFSSAGPAELKDLSIAVEPDGTIRKTPI